jgi:hypothetical protein
MNRKDIIRVFMDADGHMNDFNGGIEISWDNLMKGAMQLIEAEREACAKLCEEMASWHGDLVTAAYDSAADAIRKRG